MIVKSIFLENIRSYKSEEVFFEDGINFLSGDIGSGKSTILIALEFALFGFKRGDVEGVHLLRKGEKNGSVKLVLHDTDGTQIEIFRTVKKGKDSIGQDNGYIKIGNAINELAPTELNSHIFELLNFPKEFLTKDKNLIYRHTVYTAQEQLKEILFTDDDKRVEIIRKLFNIDKYKQLREAVSIYIGKIKQEKTLLLERVKNKDEIVNSIKEIKDEIEVSKEKIEKISLDELSLKEKAEKCNSSLKVIEEYIDKHNEKLMIVEKNLSKIEEIEEMNKRLKLEIEEKNLELKKLLEKNNQSEKEKILKEIEANKKEIERLKIEKKSLSTKLDEISKLEEERNKLSTRALEFEHKKNSILSLRKSFDIILTKCRIKDTENMIKKLSLIITKSDKIQKEIELKKERVTFLKIENDNFNLKINENFKIIKSISSQKICNTCLQEISDIHRGKMSNQIEQENSLIEKNIEKNKIEIESIQRNLEVLNLQLKDVENSNKKYIEFEQKLKNLNETYEKEKKLNDEVMKLEKEIENIDIKFIEKEIKEIDLKINSLKDLKKKFEEIENLILKLGESEKELEISLNNVENSKKNADKLEIEIKLNEEKYKKALSTIEKKDDFKEKSKILNERILKAKSQAEKYKELREKIFLEQKEISSLISSLKTRVDEKQKNLKEKEDIFSNIDKIENKLKKLIDDENYLSNKLIPIAQKAEKMILTKYFVEFNEIFSELFHNLIEDSEIDVRLNEDFCPVIEQNGYDTDVKNLSGGEKSSLAIAYRLGLKKVIENNLGKDQKLNLLVLDEPTDGFSNEQIDRLGEMLKESEIKQIILVSHDKKIESISDLTINIEKRHHISQLSN